MALASASSREIWPPITMPRACERTVSRRVCSVGLAATARADVAKGDACASNLSAVGKQIYAATVAARPTSASKIIVIFLNITCLLLRYLLSRSRSPASAPSAAMASAKDATEKIITAA